MKRKRFIEQCLKDMRQALLGTHKIVQTRAVYHYRGADLNHPELLGETLTVRKSLSPIGRYIESAEGRDMLGTILLKVFELGRQYGRDEEAEKLAPYKKIAQDIQNAHHVTEYIR